MTTQATGCAKAIALSGKLTATDTSVSLQVEVSSSLLEQQQTLLDSLITLAFDTLQASYLDLRVVPSRGSRAGLAPGLAAHVGQRAP